MSKGTFLKFTAYSVFVAFLLNVLLPFFANYNFPSNTGAALASQLSQQTSLFGDKLIICTSDGFKLVSWKDLMSGKEKPKPHPEFKCPLCYVASKATKHTLPEFRISLETNPNTLFAPALGYYSSLKPLLNRGGKLSRAPPIPMIA